MKDHHCCDLREVDQTDPELNSEYILKSISYKHSASCNHRITHYSLVSE